MRDFVRFVKGVLLKPTTKDKTFRREGSLFVDFGNNKITTFLNGLFHRVVTHDQSEVLTNKEINAENNTIQNITNVEISSSAAIERSKLADEAVITNAESFLAGSGTELSDGSDTTLHNHNSLYYTESELDPIAILGNNVLDDRYYTESEIDTTLDDYYNKSELNSTVDSDSGADKVGSTTITEISGTTVQSQLEDIGSKSLLNRSQTTNPVTKVNDATLIKSEQIVLVDGSLNSVTITLPDESTQKEGSIYEIKAIDITNEVKVVTFGAEKIDSDNQYIFNNKNEVRQFVLSGGNWFIL